MEEEEEDSSDVSSDESSKEEEEDEEFQINLKQNEYFSMTTCENNRHHWLYSFYSQRLQHLSQVKSLLESLDPSGTDILALGEDYCLV